MKRLTDESGEFERCVRCKRDICEMDEYQRVWADDIYRYFCQNCAEELEEEAIVEMAISIFKRNILEGKK